MRLTIVGVFVLVAATAAAGIIEHHVYTPTTLPSAQGWTFQSNGFDESDVFSIVGDVLVMDTIGSSFGGELHFAHYIRSVGDPDLQSAVLQIRARVTAYEFESPQYDRGFIFGGHAPGWGPWYLYGLQDGAVYVDSDHLQDLDTSAWHDYTVVTEGYHPDSQSTLLIDGEEVVVMTGDTSGAILDAFAFGDHGLNSNARVEISRIELTTFNGAPVATESVTLTSIKSLFTD
jgi:hypothetical protein